MTPSTLAVFAFSLALLWQAGDRAFARGAAEDVASGNAAYSRGNVEQAVGLYDRARREAAESTVPLLDFGIALYEKGDYAAALTAFQDIRTPSAGIAAEVHYDQGNALARLGKAAEKDEPETALDFYARSVAAYKRALAVDPRMAAAATNIEVVRAWMKSLRDAQEQASSGNQPGQAQGQGSAAGQPGQGQGTPGSSPQTPNAPGANPGPGHQAPQAPGSPPAASGPAATPQNETAEAIVQEERDRRQAEAASGGRTANESPNW